MSISLLILPGIYFLLFMAWAALSLANVYHVIKYASWTRMPLVLVSIYFLLAILIIGGTGFLMRDVDWQDNMQFETPSISIPDALPGVTPSSNSNNVLTP